MFDDDLPEDELLIAKTVLRKKDGLGRTWGNKYKDRRCCGVFDCSSCTYTCQNLWFFNLPLHSKERRRKWLNLIGRPETQLHHSLLVCEKHFAPSDIRRTCKSSKLSIKKGKFPTLLLPAPWHSVDAKPKFVYEKKKAETKVYKRTISTNEEPKSTKKLENKLESNGRDSGDRNIGDNNSSIDEELPHLSSVGKVNKTMDSFIKFYIKFKDETKPNKKIDSDKYKSKMFQLYNKNTQIYKFLQSTLGLPPVSTLPSFLPSTIDEQNEVFVTSLKGKISLKPLRLKYGILCLSIMQVQPCVNYDYNLDAFSGVCGGNNVAPTQYAVVAMVRGIGDDWYHIASIYFLAALNVFTEFNLWFDKLIMTMREIGINVKAVVTSTDDFFINALTHLNQSITRKDIYHVFDPLHLMLLLYDELKEYTVCYERPQQSKKIIAKWEHISKFYEHDSTRKFRLTHRSSCINPDDWQQNKLKLAPEILNLSTATGISTFVDLGILNKEAMDTVDFIVKINSIFAVLYPDAFQPEDKHSLAQARRDFWDKNIDFLNSIMCTKDAVEVKSKVKFVNCFNKSMESIALLQETYSLNPFASVLTYNLNQNPLMEFIHKINLKSFKHKYPTVSELLEIINSNLMQNNFHNMESEVDIMENFIENANKVFEKDSNKEVKCQIQKQGRSSRLDDDDYTQMDHEDAGTILFVATYLLDKMYQQYKNAVTSRMIFMSSSVHYENRKTGISGSLIIPNNDFLQFVFNMDSVFVNFCKKAMGTGRFYVEMMKEMNKLGVTGPIDGKPRDYIVSLFVDLRIYHTIKYNNNVYDKDGGGSAAFVVKRLY